MIAPGTDLRSLTFDYKLSGLARDRTEVVVVEFSAPDLPPDARADACQILAEHFGTWAHSTPDGACYIGLAAGLPRSHETVAYEGGTLTIMTGGAVDSVAVPGGSVPLHRTTLADIADALRELRDEVGDAAAVFPNGSDRQTEAEPLAEAFRRHPGPNGAADPGEGAGREDAPQDPPEPDTGQRLTTAFTVFTNRDGRLSKRFVGGPFESIVKYSGVQLAKGRAQRVDLVERTASQTLEDLKACLAALTSAQAVGVTTARSGRLETTIITQEQEADRATRGQGKPDQIARTKANFPWPDGPGLLLCDADDLTGLRAILIDLWPGFADVAMLVRPSASAGIRHSSSGETLTGGEHVFLVIDAMARSKDVLDGVLRLAWVKGTGNGRGFIKVARDGSALMRGPVDVSTASPERLIFEGPPEVEPPIVATNPRIPVVHPGGVLDVEAFLGFVEAVAPADQVKERVDTALLDPELRQRQDAANAAWIERRTAQITDSRVAAGLDPAEAESIAKTVAKQARKAFRPGVLNTDARVTLTGDDVFVTDQGEVIRLQEVLEGKHNGKTGPDPIDGPNSERGKAMIMGRPRNGKPYIHSFARAGCRYDIVAAAPARPEPKPADLTTVWDPWATPHVPAFPFDVLPATLLARVTDRAETTGCDPSAVALASFATMSGMADHRITLRPKRFDEYAVRPNLWALLVARASERKTPVLQDAAHFPRLADQADQKAYQAAVDLAGKDNAQDVPPPRCRVINGATSEALVERLSRQHCGALVLADELSGWIGAMEKYGGNVRGSAEARAMWLVAYDGHPFRQERVKGTRVVENLCVSILGSIQPERLRELGALTSDGMLQRFIPVIMRPATVGKDEERTPAITRAFASLMNGIGAIPPNTIVLLSDEARAVYWAAEAACLQATHTNDAFGSFVGKQTRTLLCLTLLLQMCEIVEGRAGPTDLVTRATIERANRIVWDFVIKHAQVFYESSSGAADENKRIAVAILKHTEPTIKARDLTHATAVLRTGGPDELRKKVWPFVVEEWLTPVSPLPGNNAWTIRDGLREHFADRLKAQLELDQSIRRSLRGQSDPDEPI